MEPNVTLVVQLVHFMFAYFILERVLFRPAVDAIQRRDKELHEQELEVAERKRAIELQRLKAESDWSEHQQELQKNIPLTLRQPQYINIEDLYVQAALKASSSRPTAEQIQKLVQDIKRMLVLRIARD